MIASASIGHRLVRELLCLGSVATLLLFGSVGCQKGVIPLPQPSYVGVPPFTSVELLTKVAPGMTPTEVAELLEAPPTDALATHTQGTQILEWHYARPSFEVSGAPDEPFSWRKGKKKAVLVDAMFMVFQEDSLTYMVSKHALDGRLDDGNTTVSAVQLILEFKALADPDGVLPGIATPPVE